MTRKIMAQCRAKSLRWLVVVVVALFSVTASMAQEKFTRGIKQISFIPKGQWITGVSVSYSQSSQDNYQFLVFENLNGDTYTFKVSPMLMYAFADNLAAGGVALLTADSVPSWTRRKWFWTRRHLTMWTTCTV